MPREHRHLGVYGVCRLGEHILLIRKARGPYTGLLDLPGGRIEFGEEPETALQREFIEETGLTITNPNLLQVASKVVRYVGDDGEEKTLHHIGLIYEVTLLGHDGEVLPAVKVVGDGEDSNGAIWVRYADLDTATLTPFAALMYQRPEP